MKLFLGVHLILWFIWSSYVVFIGAVWTGFSKIYIDTIIPFVLIGSHIQVVPYSIFAFLLLYFIQSKFDLEVRK